jgi:hypothetical protein
MPGRYPKSRTAAAFTLIALMGIALLGAAALFPQPPTQYPGQAGLIFGLLFLIDLLGILAASFPMGCARFISPSIWKEFGFHGKKQPSRRYQGHHPPCERFSSHVISISQKKYCAGCTGLSLGALCSLVGIGLLLLFPSPLPFDTMLWLGITLLLIAQVPYLFRPGGIVRLFINFGLAFGSFLVLAGTNGLFSSLFLNTYCLLLIVFLILTKTVASRAAHASICSACRLEACPLLPTD